MALLIRAFQQESLLATLSSDMALTALRLSLVTSTIAMSLLLLVGTPFAYLLARSTSPFMRVVDAMVELPIILPPVVAGVAMLMAFGRQGIIGPPLESIGVTLPFTTIAVVFAQLFVGSPFYIRAARLGFPVGGPGLRRCVSHPRGVSLVDFLAAHIASSDAITCHGYRSGMGEGPGRVRSYPNVCR